VKIVYSKHALQRIKERKISKLEISRALKKPLGSKISYKERIVISKVTGRKILEIVTKVEGNDIIIITAYYLVNKNYEN